MSRRLPLAAAMLCAAILAAATRPPQKIFPFPYTQEDLPNGLRAVIVPTTFPNIVSVYIVVQAGSRNEVEAGHTGFAHLFEHLMFKGTDRFSAGKYNQTLRDIGASSNAFTTDDFTCYYTTFSKEDLRTVLDMEADRFQHLKYDKAEFATEALAVLGEYNKNASSPYSKLEEVLYETAFDKHTYRHTTIGFLKDIQDMPNQYDYSLEFFGRYYRPEYITILIAGDVRPRAVRPLLEKFWGGWKRGAYKPDIPAEPPQGGPRTAKIDWPNPTLATVAIAFKAPAYTDQANDNAALVAFANLAFSENSALYQKLVLQEQRAESLDAAAPRNLDPSLFEVTARARKPEDLDYLRNQILGAIKAGQEKPFDPARLDALKKHLRYTAALQMDSSDAAAETLVPFIALRRTPESMNKLYDRYAALTPEDVRQAAAKYLTDANRTAITLRQGAAQ